MKRKLSAILSICMLGLYCSCATPPVAGNGGGIETVALVVSLPKSMQHGGEVVYGDSSVTVVPGATSFTISVPKTDSIFSVQWISNTDTVLIASGISATNGVSPKVILLVTGQSSLKNVADSLLCAQMRKEGVVVLPVPDTLAGVSDTVGMDGICISTTAQLSTIPAALKNSAKPVIDCNYRFLNSLGLSGSAAGKDFGSRNPADTVFVNPNRPGSAGLSGLTVFVSAQSDSLGHLDWAVPPPGAAKTVVDPADTMKTQAFCLETGAALIGGDIGQARRAAFLFWQGDAIYTTSQAKQVFRAIVRWTFLRN